MDSFTASRFDDPYILRATSRMSEFFKQLATGKTEHYQLIAEFNMRYNSICFRSKSCLPTLPFAFTRERQMNDFRTGFIAIIDA
ncbi:MAG: hypothetical protein U0X87_13665 [Anaerolineales bacterium]